MLVMFVVVIPRITKIFTQVNAELPLQTTALIFTADIVKNYWYLLFILAVLAVWGFLDKFFVVIGGSWIGGLPLI